MMYGGRIFTHGGYFGHSFFGGGWSWLIGIGVVLIIVAVTYLLVKRNKKTQSKSAASETLDLRFVKGDINEEEYTKFKNVLEGK